MIARFLLRRIDLCLPPELVRTGHWEQLYQGRALAGTLLLAISYALILLPVVAWLQREDDLYLQVVTVVGPLAVGLISGCLWMLRHGFAFVLIGNIFMAMGWIPLVYIFLVTGGFPHSPMMMFMLVHPVQAFLTAGPRSALFWCLISLITIGVLVKVDAKELVPQVSMGAIDTVVLATWIVCCLVLFACFWFFNLLNRRLTESIGRERDLAGFAAAHDPLTGLMNRAAFGRRVESALARVRQLDRELALMLIDLDGFKAVNDSLGHHAGDLLLCELAKRMRVAVRDSDLVARIGGDEFAVLLEGMQEGPALQRLVDELLATLAEPVDCEGHIATVSASIGVALWPRDGVDAETLQRSADRAMYAAKAGGRAHAVYSDQLAAISVAARTEPVSKKG